MSSLTDPAERWHGHGQRALQADQNLDPLADPEQIVIHGDWHGAGPYARRALRDTAKSGARTHLSVGDFGIWPGRDGERFLDEVEATLAELDAILLFVDGNHEDFDQLYQYPISPRHGLRCVRPRLYHLPRGFRWRWHELTWLALGGATSLDRGNRTPGVSWWHQEEITWRDAEDSIAGGPADIMLTHDAPLGVSIPNLPPASSWAPHELHRATAHRALLRQVVDEVGPTHLIHGHFHSRYQSEADFDQGTCEITGLDRDGTFAKSWLQLDLDRLYLDSALRREAPARA